MDTQIKTARRNARRRRIRAQVYGSASRPRLAVFRSNTRIVAQVINDEKGETITTVSSEKEKGATPRERAIAAGATIAKRAQEKKVTTVVFDRGGNAYMGSIKAFADAAREAGLTF